MSIDADLSRFDVSVERGFLPGRDPLCSLPDDYAPWEETARDLPKLLMSGAVRRWLAAMPHLEIDGLTDTRALDRAMLLLSYFGSAWVWGEAEPNDRLPATIAAPWYEVSKRLGRPPVLSYASHALNNWRRLDQTRDIELGNIVRLCNFLGGLDEEWFVLVHIAIEAKAGPAMAGAIALRRAIAADDPAAGAEGLEEIAATLRTLISILERMPENCDPYIYYRRVRPFIFGWVNPALPNGVAYDGVADWEGQGQRFRGETGAQSAIIPAIDAALGIRFQGSPEFAEHLARQRDYMPPSHRAFVAALEEAESKAACREWVSRHAGHKALAAAFNDAVERMHAFRRQHLAFAGAFIARQEAKSSSNPVGTGTGGTPFMSYLHDHAERTLAHRV